MPQSASKLFGNVTVDFQSRAVVDQQPNAQRLAGAARLPGRALPPPGTGLYQPPDAPPPEIRFGLMLV
jgi:hypothetical protein